MVESLIPYEETLDLLDRAQAGDREAEDRIIRGNQRLVVRIASRYYSSGYGGDQEITDLIQWGNIGLFRAIQKWDRARGFKFSTYASHWIEGVIRRNGMIRGLSLGATHREIIKLSAIRKARAELIAKLEREPTAEELSEKAGIDRKYIEKWIPALQYHVHLDKSAPADEESESSNYERIANHEEGPESIAERRSVFADLVNKIQLLPENQRVIMTRLYICDPPHTYERISSELKITYQGIQYLRNSALIKIREMIKSDG